MNTYSVWYKIAHADYPHCNAPMVLISGLDPDDANRVAIQLGEELKYILGDDMPILTWAD